MMQWFSYLDKREVLQQEYSQPPILPPPHYWFVVYTCTWVSLMSNYLKSRVLPLASCFFMHKPVFLNSGGFREGPLFLHEINIFFSKEFVPETLNSGIPNSVPLPESATVLHIASNDIKVG